MRYAAIGLVWLIGCGRIGFDTPRLDDDGGELDSSVIDGPVIDADSDMMVDADPDIMVDAMALSIDATLIDAAPMIDAKPPVCNLGLPCPAEVINLSAGAAGMRSGELFNQGDDIAPVAGCPFPPGAVDYTYQFNLLDPGTVSIASPSATGWYLTSALCGGNVVMCSSTGGMDTADLSAGTYTLVVEDVGATGQCKGFSIAFVGPP